MVAARTADQWQLQPKQARSKLSTRRLLDAAGELVAENGYEGTTLAAIGERAGYSQGLVTRRFGTKENLLRSLVDQMTIRWSEQRLKPLVGDAVGVDALTIILDSIGASIKRSPREMRALYALMFEALKPIPVLAEIIGELHATFRHDIEDHLVRGQETGTVVPEIDPQKMASVFVGTLRGLAYQWMLAPDEIDLPAMLQYYRDDLERTLRSVPADRR